MFAFGDLAKEMPKGGFTKKSKYQTETYIHEMLHSDQLELLSGSPREQRQTQGESTLENWFDGERYQWIGVVCHAF